MPAGLVNLGTGKHLNLDHPLPVDLFGSREQEVEQSIRLIVRTRVAVGRTPGEYGANGLIASSIKWYRVA